MICHIARWCLSAEIDEGARMPKIIRSHFRRCDACAEYARLVGAVEILLREGGRFCERTPPISERHVSSPSRALAWACMAAIAVCAAGAAIYMLLTGTRDVAAPAQPTTVVELQNVGHEPTADGFESLTASVLELVSGQQLGREMWLLIESARAMAENMIAAVNVLPD